MTNLKKSIPRWSPDLETAGILRMKILQAVQEVIKLDTASWPISEEAKAATFWHRLSSTIEDR